MAARVNHVLLRKDAVGDHEILDNGVKAAHGHDDPSEGPLTYAFEHRQSGFLQAIQMMSIFIGRRLRIDLLEFAQRGFEPAVIGGAFEDFKDVGIGTYTRRGREMPIYLARQPAAPISAKNGTEQKDMLHLRS